MSEGPDERDDTVGGTEARPPTTEYPAEMFTPTGHLPASGELPPYTGQFQAPLPPPEPPSRTGTQRAVVVGSIAVIVAVVVAVVVVVATNRGGNQAGRPTGAPPTATTTAPAATSTTPSRPTTSAPPSSTEGWHEVDNTTASGLTYSVPRNWQNSTKSRSTGRGEQWGGVAQYGTYECPQGQYTRAFVASGKAPTGDRTDLGQLATSYAKSLATHWYTDPRTELGQPQPRQVGEHEAVMVTAKLTVTPDNPECDAGSGEVVVLAVRLDRGVGVLAAVNDLQGGPSDPPCAPDGVIQQVFGTVRVR